MILQECFSNSNHMETLFLKGVLFYEPKIKINDLRD